MVKAGGDRILIVDFETDSLPKGRWGSHQGDYSNVNVLECSLVGVDLASGEYEVFLDTLVRPHGKMRDWRSSWFMTNSGLDPALVEGGSTIRDVCEVLCLALRAAPITAYNLNFELSILRNYGIRVPRLCECLMITSAELMELPHPTKDQPKYPKFEKAYNFFLPGRAFKQLHRAGDDVLKEAELAIELYERIGYSVRNPWTSWAYKGETDIGKPKYEHVSAQGITAGYIRKEERKETCARLWKFLSELGLSKDAHNLVTAVVCLDPERVYEHDGKLYKLSITPEERQDVMFVLELASEFYLLTAFEDFPKAKLWGGPRGSHDFDDSSCEDVLYKVNTFFENTSPWLFEATEMYMGMEEER